MNLQILRPDEALSVAEATARGADSIVASAAQPLPERGAGISLFASVDAASPGAEVPCKTADDRDTSIRDEHSITGASATHTVACPNDASEEHALDKRVQEAAKLATDGVVLDAPDAWYAAGAREAGFCASCEAHL